ncbi:PepSY domain-containing protein [Candidatus Woesearchaeota archaeon]|nr:PepSY domain-containing protein [Candidatus Woesearchaeota archaeon]
MESKNLAIMFLIILVAVMALGTFLIIEASRKGANIQTSQTTATGEAYNPQINPADFSTKINNKYLTFAPGTKYIYEGSTEEGVERTEVYVTNNIKKIMGVNVIEVRDMVFLDDELIEDTKDWYSQDKFGNVWYFGEDSKELIDGKVASTEGSWVAGYYGAKPGIVMPANPEVGDVYRQEYFPGEAEDMGEVVSLGVSIKVKYGSFSNCLQTKDWNPLEPGDEEYKYYCPEVGNVVYEVGIEDGEFSQLIDVKKGSDSNKQTEIKDEPVEELKTQITEEEAKAIALKRVPGRVTDFGIEKKFGKATYVVEIDPDSGPETDVIIDIETGEVLGIET